MTAAFIIILFIGLVWGAYEFLQPTPAPGQVGVAPPVIKGTGNVAFKGIMFIAALCVIGFAFYLFARP